jgi:hypothetical protein
VLSPLVVQNPADSGTGTLRDAITQANANPAFDQIILDLTGSIDLTSPLPVLTGNYKIDGPGANQLTVERNGGPNFRILTVGAGANVEIDGVTIESGYADASTAFGPAGGGIYNAGSLRLDGVELRYNAAILGGAFYNSGNATVTNSTFDVNDSTGGQGAAYFVATGSSLLLTSSTVAQNYASGQNGVGGGLVILENAQAELVNCTVTDNHSYYGAAAPGQYSGAGLRVLYNFGVGIKGQVELFNTLIANNYDGTNTPDDVLGPINGASRYNLIGDGDVLTGIADANGGNLIGTAAQNGPHYLIDLGPLQYNDNGPTRTTALLMGSDAIDAGSNDYVTQTTDQTGRNRIVNSTVDIGAYEYQPGGTLIKLDTSSLPVAGQLVTLTATVTAATPGSNPITGLVTFYYNDYDPATFLAQVPVINGKAVLANVKIPANAQIIAAQYEGSGEFSGTNTQINVAGGFHGNPATLPGTSSSSKSGTGASTGTSPSGADQTMQVIVPNGKHASAKHVHLVIHGAAHPRRARR